MSVQMRKKSSSESSIINNIEFLRAYYRYLIEGRKYDEDLAETTITILRTIDPTKLSYKFETLKDIINFQDTVIADFCYNGSGFAYGNVLQRQ